MLVFEALILSLILMFRLLSDYCSKQVSPPLLPLLLLSEKNVLGREGALNVLKTGYKDYSVVYACFVLPTTGIRVDFGNILS